MGCRSFRDVEFGVRVSVCAKQIPFRNDKKEKVAGLVSAVAFGDAHSLR